jgi:hypothetical protein
LTYGRIVSDKLKVTLLVLIIEYLHGTLEHIDRNGQNLLAVEHEVHAHVVKGLGIRIDADVVHTLGKHQGDGLERLDFVGLPVYDDIIDAFGIGFEVLWAAEGHFEGPSGLGFRRNGYRFRTGLGCILLCNRFLGCLVLAFEAAE